MGDGRVRWIVLGSLAVAACSASHSDSPMSGLVTHAIEPDARLGAAPPADYLDQYIERRSVVQLGESIHITEEFPRVRLQLVQRLHGRLSFDVLAFEGTAIGSWLAQDHIYRSKEPLEARARRAQELAWFGLWQTEPMLEVMKYVAQSAGTPQPLYLASFDIQPGSSRAFGGSAPDALDAWFSAVGQYEPPPKPDDPARWRDAIGPLLSCSGSGTKTPTERQVAEQALHEVSSWLGRARAAVEHQSGARHALALQQIPASLRASIELCRRVEGAGIRAFQENRDALNAERALDLLEHVSGTRRLMLWAHHSHINHNVTGNGPASMGQHLRERLGDELYTIGVFAGEGQAVEIREDSVIPVVPRNLPPARDFGIEGLLASARAGSYFVDLTSLRAHPEAFAAWLEPLSARYEVFARAEMVLARDFDAAVFVRKVHATPLLMVPARFNRLFELYGWVLDHILVISGGAAALLALIARRFLFRAARRPRRFARWLATSSLRKRPPLK